MAELHDIYIGLGSNLDDPEAQVKKALRSLEMHPNFSLLACSPWYRSKPVGPQDQPDFVNGVVHCTTYLKPDAALDALQQLENIQNRQRSQHWGPRTLDLDILLFGNQIINTERLTIPHPHMLERNFVLQPLLDIAPDLLLPDGRPIGDILHIIGVDGLTKIAVEA